MIQEMVLARVHASQQDRVKLWKALEPELLMAMGAKTSPLILFLEKVSIMRVADLQDVIASFDPPRELDDRAVAYELRHEALRRLVQERKKGVAN